MTDPASRHDSPPVLFTAGDTNARSSPASIRDALEDHTAAGDIADYLGVAYWACPFCDTTSETVGGIRNHISSSTTDSHQGESGPAPSEPIPGYSQADELVAVLSEADRPTATSYVLPAAPSAEDDTPTVLTDAAPDRAADRPVTSTTSVLSATPDQPASGNSATTPDGAEPSTSSIPDAAPVASNDEPPSGETDGPAADRAPASDRSPPVPEPGVAATLTSPLPLHDFSADSPDRADIGVLRWICTLCGDFTADTPAEVVSHVHAHTDDSIHQPTPDEPVALWLSTDNVALGGVVFTDDSPEVRPAGQLDQIPPVSVPAHWKFHEEYPSVDPDDIDIDEWSCPYCDHTSDHAAGVRSHIQGTTDLDHKGRSGHYPDRPILGYRDKTAVAMLTPAEKADPNDRTACRSLEAAALSDDEEIAIAALHEAAADFKDALDILNLWVSVDEDLLANAVGLTTEEFRELRDRIADKPAPVRRDAITEDIRQEIDVQLAEELASVIDDPDITPGTLLQTPSIDTPVAALDDGATPYPDRDTGPAASDAPNVSRETTDEGTVHFTVDADDRDDVAAADAIPPSPEMAAADLDELYGYFDTLKLLLEQELDAHGSGPESNADLQLERVEDILDLFGEEFPIVEEPSDADPSSEEA
jgi:hypothetical protein